LNLFVGIEAMEERTWTENRRTWTGKSI